MPSKTASRPVWKLRLSDNSDDSWRQYRKNDPYYGLFSADRFRAKNLNEAALKEFFESGETQIDGVLQAARLHVNGGMATDDALDFGCGVGRLVLPLAKRFGGATGVDISSDYRAEAKRNCDRRGIQANEYPLDELVPLLHRWGAKGVYIQPQPKENREHWAFIFCMKDVA